MHSLRPKKMRLNRYLASCGIGSRRKCDQIIAEGRAKVNGETAEPGTVIRPRLDQVEVDGKEVIPEEKAYYLFYKPLNVLTTLDDPRGRPTVGEYLKTLPYRLFPVGRLDFDSEGLIFLTNDGSLAHRTQHPKYKLEKEYLVRTDRPLESAEENQFRRGLELEEGTTAPCSLQYLPASRTYRIILHQGWHRQIRRMFEVFGVQVASLKRVRIGNLRLGNLQPGKLRPLDHEELKELRKILGFA